jgi:hypothetical protein
MQHSSMSAIENITLDTNMTNDGLVISYEGMTVGTIRRSMSGNGWVLIWNEHYTITETTHWRSIQAAQYYALAKFIEDEMVGYLDAPV